MTKEDIIKDLAETGKVIEYNNGLFNKPKDVYALERLVDYFSVDRTCENCKFYQYRSCANLTIIHPDVPDYIKRAGCNKWRNKNES